MEEIYPDAKIEGLEKKPLIKIIDEDEEPKKKTKEGESKKSS